MAAEPHRKEVLIRGQALVEYALALAAIVALLAAVGRLAQAWTRSADAGAARAALISGMFF